MIYLASPYSHINPAVREERFLQVRFVTVAMLRAGQPVFSPIVYGKDLEKQIGYTFENWQILNDAMIKACEVMFVLCLDGWKESRGVAHEIKLARSLGKAIAYIDQMETP